MKTNDARTPARTAASSTKTWSDRRNQRYSRAGLLFLEGVFDGFHDLALAEAGRTLAISPWRCRPKRFNCADLRPRKRHHRRQRHVPYLREGTVISDCRSRRVESSSRRAGGFVLLAVLAKARLDPATNMRTSPLRLTRSARSDARSRSMAPRARLPVMNCVKSRRPFLLISGPIWQPSLELTQVWPASTSAPLRTTRPC